MEIKNLLLGLVIAVIFLMFCVYGTKLIYDNSDYEDFCGNKYVYPDRIADTCPISGELQNKINECNNEGGIAVYEYNEEGCRTDLTCDLCNKEFENANKDYTKNLFLISLIFGIVIIAVSVLFVKISAISGGLMAGSLFFIIYGTGGYWEYMDDLIRFAILGVVLGILIWLAYYMKNKKWFKKKRK